MSSISPLFSVRLLQNLSDQEAVAELVVPIADQMVCEKFNVETDVVMVLDIMALMFVEDAWMLVLLLVFLANNRTKLWQTHGD